MDLVFTSGASGAVPTTLTTSAGITSVTKSGTGIYTIVLDQATYGMPEFTQSVLQASYTKAGACDIRLTGVSLSTKTITVLTVDGDGDAVDAASGDILRMGFAFQRYKG